MQGDTAETFKQLLGQAFDAVDIAWRTQAAEHWRVSAAAVECWGVGPQRKQRSHDMRTAGGRYLLSAALS